MLLYFGKHFKLCEFEDILLQNWNASHPLLRATLEVVVKPDRGQSGPRERLMEQFIASTCDSLILTKRHPHTAISIILQVEKDDGAVSLYSHSGDEWR